MVWSPVWLKVLQTIVWLPFKSHAQSSFDKSVLLSNPHSKMVGFCFGLAMPTLVWYTTLEINTICSYDCFVILIAYFQVNHSETFVNEYGHNTNKIGKVSIHGQ